MSRLLAVLLAGVLGAATSCAPRVTIPQTQITSGVGINGRLLTVSLVNAGPRDLLLKNDCPRPFKLTVRDASEPGRPEITFGQFQTCVASYLPPLLWRVGERISAVVEFPLQLGTRNLEAEASVNVKLASEGTGSEGFKTIRVNVAPFQVDIR